MSKYHSFRDLMRLSSVDVDPDEDGGTSPPTNGVQETLILMFLLKFLFVTCHMILGHDAITAFSLKFEACTIKVRESQVLDILWHWSSDPPIPCIDYTFLPQQ